MKFLGRPVRSDFRRSVSNRIAVAGRSSCLLYRGCSLFSLSSDEYDGVLKGRGVIHQSFNYPCFENACCN